MSESNNADRPDLAAEYDEFVRTLFQRSPHLDYSKDFTHAILGVVTEIHELRNATDAINAVEESGDLLFYVGALNQVATDALGATYDTLKDYFSPADAQDVKTRYRVMMDCVSNSAVDHELNDLLDHAKRWVGYGKAPANMASVCALVSLIASSELAAATIKFDIEPSTEEIVRANMRKLEARYKDRKFTQDQALNRDLGSEHIALTQVDPDAAVASAA